MKGTSSLTILRCTSTKSRGSKRDYNDHLRRGYWSKVLETNPQRMFFINSQYEGKVYRRQLSHPVFLLPRPVIDQTFFIFPSEEVFG